MRKESVEIAARKAHCNEELNAVRNQLWSLLIITNQSWKNAASSSHSPRRPEADTHQRRVRVNTGNLGVYVPDDRYR